MRFDRPTAGHACSCRPAEAPALSSGFSCISCVSWTLDRCAPHASGMAVHVVLGQDLSPARRPPQRLRRLAESAEEGAAHALGIAKAGGLRDAVDRRTRGLDVGASGLEP